MNQNVDQGAGRIVLQGGWARPVVLERYGVPGVTRVTSTREAASLLLSLPIVSRTSAQTGALLTFRNVLRGEASPALARNDFIEAAIDAGYYVLPETFIELVAPSTQAAGQTVSDQSGVKDMFRELGRVSGLLVAKLVRGAAPGPGLRRRSVLHRAGAGRVVPGGGAPSQVARF